MKLLTEDEEKKIEDIYNENARMFRKVIMEDNESNLLIILQFIPKITSL